MLICWRCWDWSNFLLMLEFSHSVVGALCCLELILHPIKDSIKWPLKIELEEGVQSWLEWMKPWVSKGLVRVLVALQKNQKNQKKRVRNAKGIILSLITEKSIATFSSLDKNRVRRQVSWPNISNRRTGKVNKKINEKRTNPIKARL